MPELEPEVPESDGVPFILDLLWSALDGASLRLSPYVQAVLQHVFRDVSGHVPNDFIPRSTLSQICDEGVAGVIETSFDICSGPRIASSCLQ